MSASRVSNQSGEGLLWVLSLVVSIVLNGLIFFSFVAVSAWKTVVTRPVPQGEKKEETMATIELVLPPAAASVPSIVLPPPPVAPSVPPPPPQFAKTTEEQAAERPDSAAFIGERNTRATSSRAPDANAPLMPSQAGEAPRKDEIETTADRFRDGALGATGKSSSPRELPLAPAQPPSPGDPLLAPQPLTPEAGPDASLRVPSAEKEAEAALKTPEPEPPPDRIEAKGDPNSPDQEAAAPKESKLLEGPNPVDTPVGATKEAPKVTPENRVREDTPKPTPDALQTKADEAIQKPKARPRGPDPTLPGASTYKRKTSISGSVSRKGVGSLDVVDSPLGRYNAKISEVVGLQWQRATKDNMDLVLPGYLAVRFSIAPTGKVIQYDVVDHPGVPTSQQLVTRKAVYAAPIPPMPADLRKELDDAPLEITYYFYYQ